MRQQLPHVPLLQRRKADAREPLLQEQLPQTTHVAAVVLLCAGIGGANRRRVAHPQLVFQLAKQTLEPAQRAGRLDPHQRRWLQGGVEAAHLVSAVLDVPDDLFARLGIYGRHSLIPRVQITAYNPHCPAPFSQALVGFSPPKSTRAEEPAAL